MMRNFLLLAGLLMGVFACGQPAVKLQAYKQRVLPGTVPVGISEDAPPSTRLGNRGSVNYFLYLIYSPSETILPTRVWINKKAYTINVEPVDSTPVEYTSLLVPARPTTTVLVAKTPNKVVQLVPVSLVDTATPSARVRKLMETSELVVCYKWKGKTYHQAVKKMTELEPLVAQ